MTGARRLVPALALAAAATALGGCSTLRARLLRSRPEPPPAAEDSYLERGGPKTGVDLGAGEEQLLTRFQQVLEEKNEIEQQRGELMAELEALRTSLDTEKRDRDEEARLRAGAEAEADRLRRDKSDRDLKILHLQLQIAELQRTRLQLEIANVERQLDELARQQPGQAAPTPPGDHR
jgi:hypothetical protein